jgi:hypothetical protein
MTDNSNGLYPPHGTLENTCFDMERTTNRANHSMNEHTFRWRDGNWYSKTTGHGPFPPKALKQAGWEIVVKPLLPPAEFKDCLFHELAHGTLGYREIWCFFEGHWYYSGPNKVKPEAGQTYFTPEAMTNFTYCRLIFDACIPAPENRKSGCNHYVRHPHGHVIEWQWGGQYWNRGTAEDFGKRGWVYLRPVPEVTEVLQQDARITELLEANNREVEAHRATKAKLRALQTFVDRMAYGCTHGI